MSARRWPEGVPVFDDKNAEGHVLQGVAVGHKTITVWCDECLWVEPYSTDELIALNQDARAMLAIAKAST